MLMNNLPFLMNEDIWSSIMILEHYGMKHDAKGEGIKNFFSLKKLGFSKSHSRLTFVNL